MSLGIIQRERTAYGKARADEKGTERGEWWESGKEEESTEMSVELLDKFL